MQFVCVQMQYVCGGSTGGVLAAVTCVVGVWGSTSWKQGLGEYIMEVGTQHQVRNQPARHR